MTWFHRAILAHWLACMMTVIHRWADDPFSPYMLLITVMVSMVLNVVLLACGFLALTVWQDIRHDFSTTDGDRSRVSLFMWLIIVTLLLSVMACSLHFQWMLWL